MILTCKITSVDEAKTVTFKDGREGRVMRVWITPECDSGGKTWNTFIELWNDKVSAFLASGMKEQDQVSVEILPGYRRMDNGSLRQRTIMNIIELEQ